MQTEPNNILQKYIQYLKDNPRGYWFKRKLFGWGWTPARWQGFVVVLIYVVALIYIFTRVDRSSHSVSDTLFGIFVPFVFVTLVLIGIGYWKGERPKWMWGLPKNNKDKNQGDQ